MRLRGARVGGIPDALPDAMLRGSAPLVPQRGDIMAIDVGSELRTARETKGLSIATLAQRIRVQPRTLSAIELNDLSSLPPRPFGRGFVRAYAEEVDLDPDRTVERFACASVQLWIHRDSYLWHVDGRAVAACGSAYDDEHERERAPGGSKREEGPAKDHESACDSAVAPHGR